MTQRKPPGQTQNHPGAPPINAPSNARKKASHRTIAPTSRGSSQ
ncbi:hypothetical protein [Mobiluncus mulieris]|nr:hypothetical protein [Mobiluncus mulieris]